MGRTSDEEGETSTKVCKTDDIDDRPLKKARYVWQIKGKYHLKKPEDDKVSCFPSKSSVKEESSSVVTQFKHNTCNTDNNLSTIDVSEKNSIFPDTNILSEKEVIPEKCNSLLNIANCAENNAKTSRSEKDNFPASQPEQSADVNAVFPNIRPSTRWQLRKWQARQVARCFVDNTINRVLEDMGFVPLPVDADDILDEFPMTESENDEGLEDEAVLMAIHRHGLRTEGETTGQSTDTKISNTNKIDPADDKPRSEHQNAVSVPCVCTVTPRQDSNACINLNPFHHRPVLWEQRELDAQSLLQSNFTSELNSNEIIHQWFSDGLFSSVINSESSSDSSCEESMMDQDTLIVRERIPGESATDDSENMEKSEELSSPEKQADTMTSFEHSDFLDKAVAVAIQKKGLSKLSCADYG